MQRIALTSGRLCVKPLRALFTACCLVHLVASTPGDGRTEERVLRHGGAFEVRTDAPGTGDRSSDARSRRRDREPLAQVEAAR